MSPAGETGTSATPPRANASNQGGSKLESTPNSRGASVVSEHIDLVGVQVKEIRPWIQRDIEQAKQCKADAMLQALLQRASCAPETKQPELLQKCLKGVLPVCNGQVSAGGISSSGIEIALKKYVCPGVENDFYGPFIDATNIAIACLQEIKMDGMRAPVSAVDMIFQQNDMPMYQTHQKAKSTRKPDIVILPLKSACACFQDDNGSKTGKQKDKRKAAKKDDQKDDTKDGQKRKDHMVKNAKAKPKNLRWKDVWLASNHVPTKPEHLPVDHLKAEVPTPGPSQTPAAQPASDTAPDQSSGLTAAQTSKGGSSSKRKAADTLESTTKKTKFNPDEPDVTVQTGLYAAEMFAANVAVEHLINFIVVDDVIWTWYYDRQGTLQSSGINFIQNLPRFIVLLYALQRFKVHDWGRNKHFLPVEVEGKQCHELKIKDEELGTGGPTNVVPVTSEALTKKYGSFEDGMVEEIAKRHPTVEGHIPQLLWHHKFTNPTSAIREALGVPEPTTGGRVLYILVFRKLHPITKLHGKELFDAWKGSYHRDISPGNLMWYRKGDKLIGVLNDYDLSSLANALGPQGNERTGTVPFMALDLLTKEGQQGKVKHLYRHDLESFIWVFAWIFLRYRQGVLLERSRPLDQWATLGAIACREKKSDFLTNPYNHLPADLKTSQSAIDLSLWVLIVDCLQVLQAANSNRVNDMHQNLVVELGLTEGTYEQMDAEETVSDMDDLLGKFTGTRVWVKLSNPSPS
ncbi:uncharacterized protein F5147DRAFT_778460 [Suillus discolor]|uniref:Fungal-type protein kinase domain-containing protein n=1 Tax=Suillus discolor TaxID=1912936 RepID=A0A9P7EX28_9AGAM|nr:uncharacterized protein F5147DRAFT_778460 [Suillus discolor]KAG2096097.1 hypothetical protein F5147DRAFT_778460 [Suillus discolor]